MNDFEKTLNKIYEESELFLGDIINLSDNNSFREHFYKLVNDMGNNIRNAINDKEVDIAEELGLGLEYYLDTIENVITYFYLKPEVSSFLQDVNLLIFNWLNLVKELNINLEEINLNKDISIYYKKLESINNILTATLSLNELTHLVYRLVHKAEQVLAATPPAFDISRHYLDALNYDGVSNVRIEE